MEINKTLADMSLTNNAKQRQTPQHYHPFADNNNLEDSRSDASYISSHISQYGANPAQGAQSNYSSALKKAPVFAGNDSLISSSSSSAMSQISYEDGFQNAEYNAINEEERARRRKEDKEQKLKDFQKQTQKKAQEKLKNMQQQQKLSEIEQQMKEKERMIKAKEYAKKQRTIINKGQKKQGGGMVQVLAQDGLDSSMSGVDVAGAHTNYHAQIKKEQQYYSHKSVNNKDLSEVIQEASENEEKTSVVNESMSQLLQSQQMQQYHPQLQDKFDIRDLYQRIDQEELQKLGVGDKQELNESAIPELHQFSMLQRFRQNKDFKQADRYNKQQKQNQQKSSGAHQSSSYTSSQADKENKWWLSNTNTAQSEQEQKQKIEKTRYLKALKALVQEKGEKLDVGEIPSLCSCGALNENLQSMKKGQKQLPSMVHMCASNCQFYKNEKDYEKALRDILHSISLFK